VQPTASAMLALKDWKLTTSTVASTYRHADRPVNESKPAAPNTGHTSRRIARVTSRASTHRRVPEARRLHSRRPRDSETCANTGPGNARGGTAAGVPARAR
jgi:hypothetical protein